MSLIREDCAKRLRCGVLLGYQMWGEGGGGGKEGGVGKECMVLCWSALWGGVCWVGVDSEGGSCVEDGSRLLGWCWCCDYVSPLWTTIWTTPIILGFFQIQMK